MSDTTTSEPQWLSPEEQMQWRRYLEGTARLSEALTRWHDEHLSVSLSEYEVLVRLSESSTHRLRMSQLADGLAYSRSRVTHTVRRMESRGLVTRTAASNDKRGIECTLTDEGLAVLEREAPLHVAAVRRFMIDALSPTDLKNLGRAMSRIGQSCREDD